MAHYNASRYITQGVIEVFLALIWIGGAVGCAAPTIIGDIILDKPSDQP
jgi:hypothetical protein